VDLRTKKTLAALLRAVVLSGAVLLVLRGRTGHFAVTPAFLGCTVLLLASVGYTWWWYGESAKAVEMREKAGAKPAAGERRLP
jgi:hypothetical protein